jgi:nitroreductase
MDAMEAIATRRSVRKYLDTPVPPEVLDKVLEAARIAPSASNVQSWKFKVVTDPDTRKQLRELAMGQKFVEQAPVVIACCLDLDAYAEKGKRARELVFKGKVRPSMELILRYVRGSKDGDFDPERMVINGVINVSIAVENMVLAATALGLGTCWVRAFDAPAVESLLDIPEGVSALVLLTIGYPDESPAARPRKSMEEILLGSGLEP